MIKAHHAGPGLNLALPVTERGQGRDDDVGPPDAQELAQERQRRDALRRLAQALRARRDRRLRKCANNIRHAGNTSVHCPMLCLSLHCAKARARTRLS